MLNSEKNLYLHLGCDRHYQSFVRRQYVTYPFRLSRPLRLDPTDRSRAYLYMMNASPGLLAGDSLSVALQLDVNTSLYLTDQSATKVHSMPIDGTAAKIVYEFQLEAGANLEFVPEPLILYADSTLEQIMQVTLHATSRLFLSEVIVPGRLARGEFYCFRHYLSRLQVATSTGKLLFADAMRLEGLNRFKESRIFSMPAMANIFIVLPETNLKQLTAKLDLTAVNSQTIVAGSSSLPNCNGLIIRAMADSANVLKSYIRDTLNYVRQVTDQPTLPEIPK